MMIKSGKVFLPWNMKRILAIGCFFAAAVLWPAASSGQEQVAACVIERVTNVVFPVYVTNQTEPSFAQGAVDVNCLAGTAFEVQLDYGLHYDGSLRNMKSAEGDLLGYRLCQDTKCSTPWGDGTADPALSGRGTGEAVSYAVFGEAPGGQGPPPDPDYRDTVAVTVLWDDRTQYTRSAVEVVSSVEGTCEIRAFDFSFGTYVQGDPAPGITTGGRIEVSCTEGQVYYVGLDSGSHPSGTQRNMEGPGGTLIPYALYHISDNIRTPWGDIGSGTEAWGVGRGSWVSYPVHGEMRPGDDVPLGQYKDTVTATIVW
jgi:spore coat protein U-like protein